jgi:hypothetical protein
VNKEINWLNSEVNSGRNHVNTCMVGKRLVWAGRIGCVHGDKKYIQRETTKKWNEIT